MKNQQTIYNFDDLYLWSGRNLEINEHLIIKHPRISDILQLGNECERQYMSLLNALASNLYEKKLILWSRNIDYETVTEYGAFCFLFYESCQLLQQNIIDENIYGSALKFFIGKDNSLFCLINQNEKLVFVDINNPEISFGENEYLMIQTFLRSMHYWTMEEYAKPANANVKKIMMDLELEQLKENTEWESFLGNIVSCVVNINIEIDNLPIYRVYNAFKRKQKEINYNQVMAGYYAGNVKLTPAKEQELIWHGKLK
jgi:hypothetical protein